METARLAMSYAPDGVTELPTGEWNPVVDRNDPRLKIYGILSPPPLWAIQEGYVMAAGGRWFPPNSVGLQAHNIGKVFSADESKAAIMEFVNKGAYDSLDASYGMARTGGPSAPSGVNGSESPVLTNLKTAAGKPGLASVTDLSGPSMFAGFLDNWEGKAVLGVIGGLVLWLVTRKG